MGKLAAYSACVPMGPGTPPGVKTQRRAALAISVFSDLTAASGHLLVQLPKTSYVPDAGTGNQSPLVDHKTKGTRPLSSHL